MASFYDDFERANGAIGNDWQVDGGTATIQGGKAFLTGSCAITHSVPGLGADRQWDLWLPLATPRWGVVEIWPAYGGEPFGIYGLAFNSSGSTLQLTWKEYHSGSWTTLHTSSAEMPTLDTMHFTVTYAAGVCAVKMEGEPVDSYTFTQGYTGSTWYLYNAAYDALIDAVNVADVPTATMEVTPDPLWVGGGPQEMVATGTGTSWTVGVPGSSTLTVDHGTISDQRTTDATTIRFTFTPAEYVGTLTFTESLYGLTDTVNSTLVPQEGQGTGLCPFDADFIAAANRTADGDDVAALLTTTDPAWLEPSLNIPGGISYTINLLRGLYGASPPEPSSPPISNTYLDHIWDAINGGTAQPVGIHSPSTDQPVKLDTEQTLQRVKDLATIENYNLASVISLLSGTQGYDHTQLMTAITSSDNQDVLDQLAAIRGDTTTSLYTLLQSLAGIRTNQTYSLGDVKGWIENVNLTGDWATHADTVGILGAIGGLALEVAAIGTAEAEDAAASSAGAASAASALGWLLLNGPVILDLLNQLKSLLTPIARPTPQAPVWPGADYVDWGEEVAIESNLPLIGEMHGVVVHITGWQGGTRMFGYDGVDTYSHLGALAFCSDRGDMEPFQAFGPVRALYTVKTMERAFACRLYRSRNVRGTIQSWKRKADL